jgi:hypothetical protein
VNGALSGGFDNPSGLDAGRANHYLLQAPVAHGPDALKIGIEAALVDIVGMADIIAHHGFLATDCTYLCHILTPDDSNLPLGLATGLETIQRRHP